MIKILFFEDDAELAVRTKFNLEQLCDCQIEWQADGNDCTKTARNLQPDICLIDVMLPGKDGFEILKELRQNGFTVPSIFLTARTLPEDAVKGFRLGAADYVRKPFDAFELVERINRVLEFQSTIKQNILEINKIKFDFEMNKVRFSEKEAELSPYEAALLRVLLNHKDKIVDYDTFAIEIGKRDLHIYRNSFYVTISTLRSKLSFINILKIKTLKNRGFLLQFEV